MSELDELFSGVESDGKVHHYSIEESHRISREINEDLRKLNVGIRKRHWKFQMEAREFYISRS